MRIDGIRLVGFKSFPDPTHFDVGSGITAIVGPNGCGKSNLIEALRWAMGETSARRIRADGMDDVIFGGTDTRPAKAWCEVGLILDNSARTAPPDFNGVDRLEVSRRLDRGDGSTYRVNGKVVRARDVQVLFQDAGVGAGSAALVSQGKVAAIIGARPTDRRSILEEAAGVAGLATRRHEAETRLRAAEQNLERAEDLEKGLSEQLAALRRQARQAERRRVIDGQIRAAEGLVFLVRWKAAEMAANRTAEAHDANERVVMEVMLEVRAAEASIEVLQAKLEPLLAARRDAETSHAVAQARLESLERELQATKGAVGAARRSRERASADLVRERQALDGMDEDLLDRRDRLAMAEDDRENDAVIVEEAAAKVAELDERVTDIEGNVERLGAEVAAGEQARIATESARADAARRLSAAETRLAEAGRSRDAVNARLGTLPGPSGEVAAADERLVLADMAAETALVARTEAMEAEERARAEHAEAAARFSEVTAELRSLKAAMPGFDAVSDHVEVVPGFETALAAALGEGMAATLGPDGGRRWVASPVRCVAPNEGRPLSTFVRVPPELAAAVSGISVVDGSIENAFADALEPGQAIVTRDGTLRRWDGYRASGSEDAAEGIRRAARARLLETETEHLAAAERISAGKRADSAARSTAAKSAEAAATQAARNARDTLLDLRRKHEAADRERNDLEGSLRGLDALLHSSRETVAEARRDLVEVQTAASALPPLSASTSALQSTRRGLEDARAAQRAARTEYDRSKREAELRQAQIEGLGRDVADTVRRRQAQILLCDEMAARLHEAEEEERVLEATANRAPVVVEAQRQILEEAAIALVDASRAASSAESELTTVRATVSGATDRLAFARETRARLLAELKAAQSASEELVREIVDRLACQPPELPMIAGIDADSELPPLDTCEGRVSRLSRERDAIGMVNPLAARQVEEMEGKLGEAHKSRNDIREAVARLRKSIADFDREARSRIAEAFALIDGHFRDLYTRLFAGGHAHLRLSGSEDPLEAGLEVYACPPGKKLQTMSLLSGGEQALAAIALIFAAFLVKPAPVCVLDEVDAPLDDANIGRLCSLVADMARDDATRFLVVTHHPLTMARADRLYGVTMVERGVSRLTALDMEQAIAFVGSPKALPAQNTTITG